MEGVADERKKRGASDLEDQPDSKRQNRSDSSSALEEEPTNEKDITVIRFQHRAMQIRIKELHTELNQRDKDIAALRSSQTVYNETLSCLNRTWTQVNDGLALVLQRVGFSQGAAARAAPADDKQTPLQVLLQTPEPLVEGGKIEGALKKKIEKTHEIIGDIVSAFEKQKHDMESLYSTLRETSDPAALAHFKETTIVADNERVRNERAEALSTLARVELAHQKCTAEIEHLNDIIYDQEQSISDLKKDLDVVKDELDVERRRVIKLRDYPATAGIPVVMAPSLSISQPSVTTTSSSANKEDSADKEVLDAQLVELQSINETRLAEIKKAREERVALLKEVSKLRDESNNLPDHVVERSAHYQLTKKQYAGVTEELERTRNQINQMQKAINDFTNNRHAEKEQLETWETSKRRQIEKIEESLSDQIKALKTENSELKQKAEVNAQGTSAQYIKELQSTITSRSAEFKKYKDECEKLRAEKRAWQAQEEKYRADYAVQDLEHEVRGLQDRLKDLTRTCDELKHREKKWIEKEREYKMTVEGYQGASKDRRDIAELRTSERRLKDEVEELHRQLKPSKSGELSSSRDSSSLKDVEKKYTDEIKAIKHDTGYQLSKAERAVRDLKSALESSKQETESLLSEIESIGKAYEDAQAEQDQLMRRLGDKEDDILKLQGENMKLKHQFDQAQSEQRRIEGQKAALKDKATKETEVAVKAEDKISELNRRLTKANEDNAAYITNLESQKQAVRDSARVIQEHKLAKEIAEKLSAENKKKVDEMLDDVELDKEKTRRLEEEKIALKKKLDRLTPRGGGTQDVMEEQLRTCQAKMRCSVCNDRPKDTVISKCFHVFCHECIQKNLTLRKRRCPGCTKAFSENDVHPLFLDFGAQ